MSWETTGLVWEVTDFVRPYRLVTHPTNGDKLWLACSEGIYYSANGGSTWSLVQQGNMQDIEFHPTNPNIVYACSDRFYKSTDGGVTFTNITAGLPAAGDINRYKMAVSPDEPDWIYLIGGDQDDSSFEGLYFSNDEGETWVVRATSPNLFAWDLEGNGSGGQSWYDMAIAVDPNDADIVYTGGINIWKSENGGVDFEINTHWVYPADIGYVHADIHDLAFFGNKFYCGSDGGAFISNDGGGNWVDLSEGLGITQFYRISGTPQDENLITGGTQDNGTYRMNFGNWTHIMGADGMETIIDYEDSDIIYLSTQRGGLRKSTNGGATSFSITGDIDENGAWVTPYVIHPNEHETLFAGFENVWKTTNGGDDWVKISDFGSNATLRVLAISPSDPDVIYAGYLNTLYRTSNGGSSWVNISSGLPDNPRLTYVTIHDNNPDSVWVSMGGYNSNSIYFSANGGNNWTNYSDGLPEIPTNCVIYQPNSNGVLYAGTDLGVYYRQQGIPEWQPYNNALPNVIVMELEPHLPSGKIRAGTYGRGVWEIDLLTTNILLDCDNSITLECGSFINGNTNSGLSNVDNYNCTGRDASGPEQVYDILLTTTDTITASLSQLNGVDLDLYLLSTCNEFTCIAFGDEEIVYEAGPGSYRLVVEGHNGAAGSYRLDLDCTPFVCPQQVEASCGQTYNGNTSVGSENLWEGYSCAELPKAGPEDVYKILLTVEGDITATLSNLSADLDVFILSECSHNSCITFGDNMTMANDLPPGEYFVVVDGALGVSGSYELQIDCPLGEAGISGTILTESGTPVQDVSVDISGDILDEAVTDNNGQYDLEIPYLSSFTATPEKNTGWRDGVTTLDLILIQQHIVQVNFLDSPEQMIAADANNNQSISITDLVALQQLILFNTDEISGNTSWRFIPTDYVWPDPSNPWFEDFPEEVSFSEMEAPVIQNFTGIKIGDVNGSTTGMFQTTSVQFTARIQKTSTGDYLELLMPTNEYLDGFQFSIAMLGSDLEILDVETLNSPGFEGLRLGKKHIDFGLLHVSFYHNYFKPYEPRLNAPILSILLNEKVSGATEELSKLKFNNAFVEAEAYIEGVTYPIEIIFGGITEGDFRLGAFPNPTNGLITIDIYTSTEEQIELEFFNTSGQLLRRNRYSATKGYNQFQVQLGADFPAGVFFCRAMAGNDKSEVLRLFKYD
jgi:hypothetical protein